MAPSHCSKTRVARRTRNARPACSALQVLALPVALAVSGLMAGCATAPAPQPSRAAVLKVWGPPTATYALPSSGERLEYASGPFGRTTWMVDVDRAGRVTQTRQVLSEAEFFLVQSEQSLTAERLLQWIGTPGERRGARGGGQTWSWRYPTNDCLWFQVSVDAQGEVRSTAYGNDPRCDAPADARS